MKRICVLGSNSGRNAGDAAILSSIIRNISEIRPGTRLDVPVPRKRDLYSRFRMDTVKAVPMMPWNLSLRFLGLPTALSVARSDVLLITDGIIFDVRLFNPLFNFLIQLVFLVPLARLFGRKTVCFLVGVGPLNTRCGRAMASFVCRRCDAVMVRERHSKELLERIGIPSEKIAVYADAAFACRQAGRDRAETILRENGIRTDERLIGININSYMSRWLKQGNRMDADRFARELAGGIDGIIESTGCRPVVVLTQVMDIEFAGKVLAMTGRRADIPVLDNVRYSPEELMSVMACMELFIGMRLHSLILAASAGTPCIGLVYAPKVRHFMELMNMEEFSLELSDLTADRLVDKTSGLLRREREIREKARQRAETLRAKARDGFRYFAEKYL